MRNRGAEGNPELKHSKEESEVGQEHSSQTDFALSTFTFPLFASTFPLIL